MRLGPTWIWLAVIGALVAWGLWERERTAQARLELADYKVTQAESARLGEQIARQEEARLEADKQREIEIARNETAAAEAATRSADAAAVGMRKQLDAYIAAARSATQDPEAPGRGEGQPGADPLDLLAELYRGADQAAGEIAGYAGRLKIAGAACERISDGLTPG